MSTLDFRATLGVVSKISIAIVEAEKIVAQALRSWLLQFPEFRICGYATTSAQGWMLCRNRKPDIILLDLCLPDGDGLDLAGRFLARLPANIIVVSAGQEPYRLRRMQQLGVAGFVSKSCAPEILRLAIHSVYQGRQFYSNLFDPDSSHDVLSPIIPTPEAVCREL